jgi:hypothetical protein
LAKQLQPVESALDLESLKGKLPFIADLSETEKTSLNSLLQEYKRNATEGPVQVLTQSELFQKVSENENLIPFRRREWKNGRREVVSEKTYEYIKKANPKDLKQ